MRLGGLSELKFLRHALEGGVACEALNLGGGVAEADGASAVAAVDLVDEGGEFLAAGVVGEEVGLVMRGGDEAEQDDADFDGLEARGLFPKLRKSCQKKIRVLRFVEAGFCPEVCAVFRRGEA